MTLTAEYRRRTIEARSETIAALDRELAYLPQNQKADVIAFYRAHIAKLDGMLAA